MVAIISAYIVYKLFYPEFPFWLLAAIFFVPYSVFRVIYAYLDSSISLKKANNVYKEYLLSTIKYLNNKK